MKRSSPLRSDPKKRRKQLQEMRRRGQERYEDRLREEGRKFSDLDRSTPVNPVNRERRSKETPRAYGPEERRTMVKRGRCAVEGCPNAPENAHLTNGGMGRKADADTIARLCHLHHRDHNDSLHNLGSVERFDERWGTDLWANAAEVEEEWQQLLQELEVA